MSTETQSRPQHYDLGPPLYRPETDRRQKVISTIKSHSRALVARFLMPEHIDTASELRLDRELTDKQRFGLIRYMHILMHKERSARDKEDQDYYSALYYDARTVARKLTAGKHPDKIRIGTFGYKNASKSFNFNQLLSDLDTHKVTEDS